MLWDLTEILKVWSEVRGRQFRLVPSMPNGNPLKKSSLAQGFWYGVKHPDTSAQVHAMILQEARAPLAQVVHVLQKLWPSHHPRGSIWLNEVGALTLWVGADLLAHILHDKVNM